MLFSAPPSHHQSSGPSCYIAIVYTATARCPSRWREGLAGGARAARGSMQKGKFDLVAIRKSPISARCGLLWAAVGRCLPTL